MQKMLLISFVFLFSSFSTANGKNASNTKSKFISPKQALENYNEARPVPNFGPAKGLPLEKVDPNNIFDKLGLKSGDSVLSYDSHPLKSPKDGIDFYKKAEQKQIKVMLIERNGERRNLSVK